MCMGSVTTQPIETDLNATHMHLDNQSRFCCQELVFYVVSASETTFFDVAAKRH